MTSCSVVDSAWTKLGLRCLVVALELQLLLSKREGPQGFYCCLNKAAYVLLRQDVDGEPPVDRETILGGPPVLQATG
jgi:hypothetical protein